MDLTIENFWKQKISIHNTTSSANPLEGWRLDSKKDEAYVQAKLSLRKDYDNTNEQVWLISAPGAVGKSTLAKEICASTGAIYLDLAEAATVAGNYIVGGLAHSGLLNLWTTGNAALVIDALDEARLRVTQAGFEDFLKDVSTVAKMGKFPIILLGRTGIIEESWTILNEISKINPPIFDIELFDHGEAERFVMARLQKLSEIKIPGSQEPEFPELHRSLTSHKTVYEEVISRVITGLEKISIHDLNKFAGYAPVLDAVAKVIAAQKNPSQINDEMQRILEGAVMIRLTNEILLRETEKLLSQVEAIDGNFPSGLYRPSEQLERIACRIFKLPNPALPSNLTQQQAATYEAAVQNLLPQHPFLNGAGTAPSSAVFSACIITAALRGSRLDLSSAAKNYTNSSQTPPNPFIYDFYTETTEESNSVPAEHIGLIIEAAQAKTKPGEIVKTSIEDIDDNNFITEITITHPDENTSRVELRSQNSGTVHLGRRVSGINIDSEHISLELGTNEQLELIAPISIKCSNLKLSCNQIAVKCEPHSTATELVTLEAFSFSSQAGISSPIVRNNAQLFVSWPGDKAYPWTNFALPDQQNETPETADALRAFRRITMAFRSHSKGRLARFKDKIEHARMLKGSTGEKLLKKFIEDKIITLEGPMYFLDADTLGRITGSSFMDIQKKSYPSQTREYVQAI